MTRKIEIDLDKPEQMADAVSRFVTVCGGYDDMMAFVKAMTRQHRTLQQNFTRLCVAWLLELAKAKQCDLRNADSVRLAKLFVERIPEDERYLPLV
jgi:hypothetical protein